MLKKIAFAAAGLSLLASPLIVSANTVIDPLDSLSGSISTCLTPAAGTPQSEIQTACATLLKGLVAIVLQLTQSKSAPSCTISTDKVSYALGETVNVSWTSRNAAYATWLPDASGRDNFYLGGDKLNTSGQASFSANILGNPFVTMQVVSANGQTATCTKVISVGGGVVISGGSLSVSPDASSPAYQIVAGGTTGVTVGAFKFHASGESIRLNKVRVVLASGGSTPANSPMDLTNAYLYDGSTLVGTLTFIGNQYAAVSTLSGNVTIPRDSDKVLTVKADIANIGTGSSGKSGDLIYMSVDTSYGDTQGSGVSSGSNISATGGGVISGNGTRIFRSYPKIGQVPLSSAGLTNGSNPILRFSITANSSGPIGIYKFAINLSGAQASLTLPTLAIYSDSGFSQPITGFSQNNYSTVYAGSALSNGVFAGGPVTLFLGSSGQALQIPAGQTYYFEVRDAVTLNGANAAVSASLTPDNGYQTLINSNGANVLDSNFFWSPNDYATSQFSDADWTNGYGFFTGGISQTRTGTGSTTAAPTATLTYAGKTSGTYKTTDPSPGPWVWSSTGGTSATSYFTVDSDDTCGNKGSGFHNQWVANTLSGSSGTAGSGSAAYDCQAGHTYTVYYVVTGANGQTATASATVTVLPQTSTSNTPPAGVFDGIFTSNTLAGWAYDPDAPSTSISVHYYVDGPAGTGTFVAGGPTTASRPDVNQYANITGTHGFNFTIPAQYLSGTHSWYVYAIDTAGGQNPLLPGSPKTMTMSTTPNPGPAAPTATLTYAGKTSGTYKTTDPSPGPWVWSSTGGTSATSYFTIDGDDGCGNKGGGFHNQWVANTLSGSSGTAGSGPAAYDCQAGHTYTVYYVVTGANGQTATASVTLNVLPQTSTSNTPPAGVSVSPMPDTRAQLASALTALEGALQALIAALGQH